MRPGDLRPVVEFHQRREEDVRYCLRDNVVRVRPRNGVRSFISVVNLSSFPCCKKLSFKASASSVSLRAAQKDAGRLAFLVAT